VVANRRLEDECTYANGHGRRDDYRKIGDIVAVDVSFDAILSRRMDERNHFAWRGVECAPGQEGEWVVGSSGDGIDCGKIDAPYRSARTRNWVKVKCTRRQEFVVIGWKRSSAKGRPFSSLLLAQNEAGKLNYKGKVGTGFSLDEMPDLAAKLARLARKTSPAQVDKVKEAARFQLAEHIQYLEGFNLGDRTIMQLL